jgi:peptidase M28-like protein/PA domain-containing protein
MYEDFLQEITFERLMEHVHKMTDISPERLSGTEAEKQTVEYFRQYLESYGVPLSVHELDGFASFPDESSLVLLGPEKEDIPSSTFAQIASTSDSGIETDVVYVGQGGEDDYQGVDVVGKIALAELSYTPPRPEKVRIATAKGAVGMVMMNWGLPEHDSLPKGTVKAIWGNPSDQDAYLLPKIPVVGITRRDGERLSVMCRRGTVRVRLRARADRKWVTSYLPEIRISGSGGSDKFILVGGHYDAWGGGVTCNAVGNAVKLELARILWEKRNRLFHNMRICFWPGHETGIMFGSVWMVDTFWKDITHNCIIYINVDSPGLKDASELMVRTSPEVTRFHEQTVERFKDLLGDTTVGRQRLTRTGDQSFFGIGVPSLYARHSPSPEEMQKMHGATLGWWYHSDADTLDKIDAANFVMDAKIILSYALGLADSQILPFEFASSADEFIRRLEALNADAGKHLDLSEEIATAEEYRKKAGRLDQAIQTMAAADIDPKIQKMINNCLIRLSRTVTPILSTICGRYGHDTYGRSALNRYIPGLDEVKALAAMHPTDDAYKLLRTRLVREKNKVYDALDTACRLIDMPLAQLES